MVVGDADVKRSIRRIVEAEEEINYKQRMGPSRFPFQCPTTAILVLFSHFSWRFHAHFFYRQGWTLVTDYWLHGAFPFQSIFLSFRGVLCPCVSLSLFCQTFPKKKERERKDMPNVIVIVFCVCDDFIVAGERALKPTVYFRSYHYVGVDRNCSAIFMIVSLWLGNTRVVAM